MDEDIYGIVIGIGLFIASFFFGVFIGYIAKKRNKGDHNDE